MKLLNQLSLAEISLLPGGNKLTPKAIFLTEIETVVLYSLTESPIALFYPEKWDNGRQRPRAFDDLMHLDNSTNDFPRTKFYYLSDRFLTRDRENFQIKKMVTIGTTSNNLNKRQSSSPENYCQLLLSAIYPSIYPDNNDG